MLDEKNDKTIKILSRKKDLLKKEAEKGLFIIEELSKEKRSKEEILNQILAEKKELEDKKNFQKRLEKEFVEVIKREEELSREIRNFEKLSLKPMGPEERDRLLEKMKEAENQIRIAISEKENLKKEFEIVKNQIEQIKEKLRSSEKEEILRPFLEKLNGLINQEKNKLKEKIRKINEIEKKIRAREKKKILADSLNQAISLYNQGKFEESLIIFENILQELEKLKEVLGFFEWVFEGRNISAQAQKFIFLIEKEIKRPPEKFEEKKYLERKEIELLFEKAVDCYNRAEFEIANELFGNLLKELEKRKKKANFFEKISFINPFIGKTRKFLEKIRRQKKKEEIEEIQLRKLKELEETIKKQKKEEELAEEIKKQKELAKEVISELPPKPAEIKITPTTPVKPPTEEILAEKKLREEIIKKEKELEKEKVELEERYREEIKKIKEMMEKRWKEELKEWEEKLKTEETKKRQEILKGMEEKLKKREEEVKKMQEIPREVLTEEEEKERMETILMAEEEIKERRRLIEEEARKIEEEMEKKKVEERPKEFAAIESEEEKQKRRLWLKETIEKEKKIMSPERKEKEKKERAESLKALFKEAVFYHQEKNYDKAIETLQELKKKLPEPKKEPGLFEKALGRVPLYFQIENYISRIEKEKLLEEKKRVKKIREEAEIAAGKKRKVKIPFLSKFRKVIGRIFFANPLEIFRRVFLSIPLIAVDISDYSIELLRLNKNFSILNYGRSIIKEGIVSEGKIKDQKDLSLAFKLAASQAGFKPFKPQQGSIFRGIVSIPEYETYVETFNFDKKENIFEKIKEEIEKTFPFSADELYWDYLEVWDEKLNKNKVLVVAALKDVIDEHIYFLKSCGVEPVVFDLEASSVGRALLTPQEIKVKGGSVLILDIGAKITNINIFDENGFVDLSTAISLGGNYLVDKIAEYFDVSREEAETIMNIKGFQKEDNVILDILGAGMEKIIEETKKIVQHYQRKFGKEVQKIILAGGTALLPKIDEFFKNYFPQIEVEIGNPLKKIKRRGGLEPEKAILFTNCLGLALRSIAKDPLGEGINLLPEKIKEKEKKVYWQQHRQKLILIRVILAILIILVILLILYLTYFKGYFKII